jgi:hypothetical protein
MGLLHRKNRWLLFIAGILTVVCVTAFVVHHQRSETADYGRLIGQWVRPDGGYVLDIRNVQSDGKLEVAYLNPKQINVSKAQANIKTGQIELFIELRDKYYPGSYYTLTYDSKSDRLVGVYHHLGIGQNFDIFFLRKQGPS